MAITYQQNMTWVAGTNAFGSSTAGASLIAVMASGYDGFGYPNVANDSKGNSYNVLVQTGTVSGNCVHKLWSTPSNTIVVGSSHSLTTNGAAAQGTCAIVFVGCKISADAYNSDAVAHIIAPGTTVQPGSITPPVNGCVVITGYSGSSLSTPTVNSPFTPAPAVAYNSGVQYANGIGYSIQTTATASNPTWTEVGGNNGADLSASQASFAPNPNTGAQSASFTAEGTFSASAGQIIGKSATFTSEGTFSASAGQIIGRSSSFTSEGTLNAVGSGGALQVALFTGEGTFLPVGRVNASNALFTGEGTFSASAGQIIGKFAQFTAEGVFAPRRTQPVTAMTLYSYQLGVGTYVPNYYQQLDSVVRQLCTANSVTLPAANFYNPVTGTLVNKWVTDIDTAVRALCVALSVTAPTSRPTNLTLGTEFTRYSADLDTCVRALCSAS